MEPSTTGELFGSILHKTDIILGALSGLLAKFTWDKVKKTRRSLSINDDEVTLDSPLSQRDSVMIWLTDRVHKVKNEMDVPLGRNTAEVEKLKVQFAYMERVQAEEKLENAARYEKLHTHIDNRFGRVEALIEKIRDKP